MKIRVLTSAFNDLADGRDFYERQGEGVGDYFMDSVFADIDSLALYGGIHSKAFGYHRMLAARFPWAIYYRIDGDAVLVFRILDCRLDPGKIRGALRHS
ncbi:MAG TPA: hypothetical protein VK961_05785 [Chthoniobacter sp.]|nr:hypothetical protein [Chthoniobacter sp.]